MYGARRVKIESHAILTRISKTMIALTLQGNLIFTGKEKTRGVTITN